MFGCGRKPAASPAPTASPGAGATTSPPQPSPAGTSTYSIRGRIEAIAADRRAVTLDHEDIPGLMPAMKMEYKVQDPVVLQGLAVSDRVEGHFESRGGGAYVITHLAKR